jgi:hypothetical protein
MSWFKRIALGVGGIVGVALAGGGIFVYSKVSAFDASMNRVYDVPVPSVVLSTDPAALARGKHLTESIAPCAASDCHGRDFGGGKLLEIGPIGTFQAPNITGGGLGAAYTDGELVRLLRHGIRKDGTSVRFMPVMDFNWMSEADVIAMISFVRSVPPVERPNGPVRIGLLGKVLDRLDKMPLDIAGRVHHENIELAPPPSPTAEFGRFIGNSCHGCHGPKLSGGPIPGAPPSMAVPLNITPHETGLKGWTYEDFDRLLMTGIRKNGKKVDPMMPVESFRNADEIEKRALFAYLETVTPVPFGNR